MTNSLRMKSFSQNTSKGVNNKKGKKGEVDGKWFPLNSESPHLRGLVRLSR